MTGDNVQSTLQMLTRSRIVSSFMNEKHLVPLNKTSNIEPKEKILVNLPCLDC